MVKKTILVLLMALISINSVLAICGDDVCDADETPDNCPFDCKEDATSYVKCLFDQEQCTYPTMYDHAKNISIFVFIICLIIFLKWRGFI